MWPPGLSSWTGKKAHVARPVSALESQPQGNWAGSEPPSIIWYQLNTCSCSQDRPTGQVPAPGLTRQGIGTDRTEVPRLCLLWWWSQQRPHLC